MTYDPDDLAGLHEAAEELGVAKSRVNYLDSHDGDFPDPMVRLAMGPVWSKDALRDWKRRRDMGPK